MFKEERNKNFPPILPIQMICDSQGCRYVDENNQTCEPKDQKEISVAEYSKGYIEQKLIEKACKWLETIDFEMEYMYSDDGYTFFNGNKFIEDFCKVMKD
jgi:hypothetical protein